MPWKNLILKLLDQKEPNLKKGPSMCQIFFVGWYFLFFHLTEDA